MESLKVLIAEDDTLGSQGLALMLAQAGHAVVGTVTDGESACTQVIEKQPDAAVVSLQIQDPDGLEVTRRIMEECPIPVVLIGTESNADLAEEAARAGAFAFLVKPVSASDLIPALTVAVTRFREGSSQRDELAQLKESLETRKFAEQAKGIIMHRLTLPEGQAYAHLREKCRNQQKTMKTASIEIIEAERHLLDQLAKDPPSRLRPRVPILEERVAVPE